MFFAAAPVVHAKVDHEVFGKLDGKPVEIYTLSGGGGKGVTASVITYGAILTRVQTPDKAGKLGDILLGYDTLDGYVKENSAHFGSLIGRVANRIAKGTFTLDGKAYHVPINDGPNSLHGGKKGYDRRLWTAEEVPMASGSAVKMSLVDPDGDQGFPGTVHVSVTYSLTERDGLRIDYEATTDKATPINLTSHGYWNLRDGGKTDVKDVEVHLHASKYLPVDAQMLPTGDLAEVAGTPFDFRHWKAIGKDLAATPDVDKHHGYDNCYVIDGSAGTLRSAALAYDPPTGRSIRMVTTEPGLQFYTGNYLDGTVTGRDGAVYKENHGFAFEAEGYPDAVNHPTFPSCVLQPGQTYHQVTEYQFSVDATNPEVEMKPMAKPAIKK